MITRLVKMEFGEENIDSFLRIYGSYKEQIAIAEGVYSVSMKQSTSDPCVVFTISSWESEIALNNYRNSALFNEVWAKVKPLFSAKPEAWSLQNPTEQE